MQVIDGSKRAVDTVNRCLSDLAGIASAMKPIGTSFIEKMNNAVALGSEKENTDDGNDLIDKMNALERRSASLVTTMHTALSDVNNSDAMTVIEDELPGQSDKMNRILYHVRFDKIDMRALFKTEDELQVICRQGNEAADRLTTKLGDQYMRYDRTANNGAGGNVITNYDSNNRNDRERMFDDTSKEHLSSLVNNWQKYAKAVQEFSSEIVVSANEVNAGSVAAHANKTGANVGVKGGSRTVNGDIVTYGTANNMIRHARNQTSTERDDNI